MTADEIRNSTQQDRDESGYWLREIAAQMAELNLWARDIAAMLDQLDSTLRR